MYSPIVEKILNDLNKEIHQISDIILSGILNFDDSDINKNYKYITGYLKGVNSCKRFVESALKSYNQEEKTKEG